MTHSLALRAGIISLAGGSGAKTRPISKETGRVNSCDSAGCRLACRSAGIAGIGQRFFLLGQNRACRGQFSVERGVICPFLGQVIFMEDRLDRTFRHTGFAIDSFIRVDVKHRFAFVKALDWANNNAIGVLTAEARFDDDVGHAAPFLLPAC